MTTMMTTRKAEIPFTEIGENEKRLYSSEKGKRRGVK